MFKANSNINLRTGTICAFGLALLSFLFPFSSGTFLWVDLSVSGLELIKTAIEAADEGFILLISPLMALAALTCSALSSKGKGTSIAAISFAAIGMIAMIIFMSADLTGLDLDIGILKPINYAGFGFYLYEIMSIIGIVLCTICMNSIPAAVKAAPAAAVRPAAPSPVTPVAQTPYAPPLYNAVPAAPVHAHVPHTTPSPAEIISGNPRILCVCERGAIEGKSVESDRIVIGRDVGSCHMIFPANTTGISKVHCKLKLKNGNIYLYDVGSSYGTYLSSGQKLQPNQPVALKDGDCFYLADKNTKMRVLLCD